MFSFMFHVLKTDCTLDFFLSLCFTLTGFSGFSEMIIVFFYPESFWCFNSLIPIMCGLLQLTKYNNNNNNSKSQTDKCHGDRKCWYGLKFQTLNSTIVYKYCTVYFMHMFNIYKFTSKLQTYLKILQPVKVSEDSNIPSISDMSAVDCFFPKALVHSGSSCLSGVKFIMPVEASFSSSVAWWTLWLISGVWTTTSSSP